MGYICHNAILITAWTEEDGRRIHKSALDLYREFEVSAAGMRLPVLVTDTLVTVNGFTSFAVLPDGSKRGWPTSNRADEFRAAVVAMCRHSDCDWAAVTYGDEHGPSCITDTNVDPE